MLLTYFVLLQSLLYFKCLLERGNFTEERKILILKQENDEIPVRSILSNLKLV